MAEHGLLAYIRLKLVATLLRFIGLLAIGIMRPNPDEILHIPSRDKGRTIKVHIYYPHSKSAKQPAPVLINAHGSGFVFGLHGQDDYFCRTIADRTGITVIDSSYRLAPENPYPAGPNDIDDVVAYVRSKPEVYDLNRLSLSGFSAGAYFPMLTVTNTDFPKDAFYSLVLFYPPANLSVDPSTRKVPQEGGRPLPNPLARFFNESFLPAGVDRKSARVSPTFAAVERFPKRVLLVTCGYDNLAPEAEEMIGRVAEAKGNGGNVVVEQIERVNHAWDKSSKEGSTDAEKRDRAYEMAVKFLRE